MKRRSTCQRSPVGNHNNNILAAEPTQHPAGSKAKIQVMCDRVAAGCSAFHPDDADGVDTPKYFQGWQKR